MLAVLLIALVLLSAFARPAQATFPGRNGDLLVTERMRSHGWDDASNLLRIDSSTGAVTTSAICAQHRSAAFPELGCVDVGPPAASYGAGFVAFAARDFYLDDPFRPSTWRVRVLSLATGEWRLVPLAGMSLPYEPIVRWTLNGSFVLGAARGRVLLAGPHGSNGGRLLTRGTAPDLSSSGRLAFVRGQSVYVRKPDGSARRLAAGDQPSWSPRGRLIAFARKGYVYTVPASGGRARRIARGFDPVWSPDGRRIAFFKAIPDPDYFGEPTTYLFVLDRKSGRVRRLTPKVMAVPGDVPPNGLDWAARPVGSPM